MIDKFSDVLVVESLALGIDRLKPLILEKLVKVLEEDGIHIRGIYERSDAKVRLQEGMERYKGFIGEPFDTKVEIVENGVRYLVDVKDGQKTGFFLDQKYNRLAIQRLCPGKRVLDCFTHTGSFALNAAVSGAKEVIGVDASELAVAQARENAELNGVSGTTTFQCADVFDLLPELEAKGEQFDVVILDPPAFTKSRSSVKNAIKGYREINIRGLRLVKDGGYFATCSCSHFMTPELFTKAIQEAARSAHRRLRQIEYRTQAADHPILWAGDAEQRRRPRQVIAGKFQRLRHISFLQRRDLLLEVDRSFFQIFQIDAVPALRPCLPLDRRQLHVFFQDISLAEEKTALKNIFKLPDISLPVVQEQLPHEIRIHLFDIAGKGFIIIVKVIVTEHRDILAPIAG